MTVEKRGGLMVAAYLGFAWAACADVTLDHADYASDAEAGAALVTAVAGAPANSTVTVGAGRWLLSKETGPVTPVSIGLTIKGASSNPRETVIDGGGVTNCMEISSWNLKDMVVSSLTVSNGISRTVDETSAFRSYGGGIYVNKPTIITNCIVTSCSDVFDGIGKGQYQWNTRYGIGVYINNSSGLLVDSLIENNIASITGAGVPATDKYAVYGAGVCVLSGTVRGCVIRNNGLKYDGASLGKEQSYRGYGIYLSGTKPLVEKCAIYGNRSYDRRPGTWYLSLGGVGGAYLESDTAVLRDSYVTDNWGYMGGGVSLSRAGARIENCDVVSNHCSQLQYGKGANVILSDSRTWMTGCRLEKGDSTESARAYYVSGSACVISNCWIRNTSADPMHITGNYVTNTHCLYTGNNGGYIFGRSGIKGTFVSDCVFIANTNSASYCGFWNMDTGNIAKNEDAGVIRNCLFYKNNFQAGTGRGKVNGAAPIQNIWDSCTFVSNNLPNGLYRFSGDGLSYSAKNGEGPRIATNLITRNCLFYQNYNGNVKTASTIWNTDFSGSPDSISNNFWKTSKAYVTAENGNITMVDDPMLVDPEHGDFRLKKGSPVIDKGVYEPWMDGARDMGAGFEVTDGVTTFTAFGETHTVGCNLVKKGAARRRLSPTRSKKPDIGATEHYQPVGISVILR